jgi:hypothetical protein
MTASRLLGTRRSIDTAVRPRSAGWRLARRIASGRCRSETKRDGRSERSGSPRWSCRKTRASCPTAWSTSQVPGGVMARGRRCAPKSGAWTIARFFQSSAPVCLPARSERRRGPDEYTTAPGEPKASSSAVLSTTGVVADCLGSSGSAFCRSRSWWSLCWKASCRLSCPFGCSVQVDATRRRPSCAVVPRVGVRRGGAARQDAKHKLLFS